MLNLNKKQLQVQMNHFSAQSGGLVNLFEMMVNSLMYLERQEFLSSNQDAGNKGNGYRSLVRGVSGGALRLSIPRDRLGQFQPVILGLLNEHEGLIKELSFELYGKGLSTREVSQVIERIYGTQLSKSSISRIIQQFSVEIESWLNRPLDTHYPIVYVDAIHQKVRRDHVATEAYYVILGVREDYTREVLSVVNFPHESASGWGAVVRDLKDRGVEKVDLFVCDSLTGLAVEIGKAFPEAECQRCVLHFMRNLGKYLRVSDRGIFMEGLKSVFYPEANRTPEQGVETLRSFLVDWNKRYRSLRRLATQQDLEQLFTYYKYNVHIRRMIYTTNWIERLNKSFRRTLKLRGALPTPEAALTLIGYVAREMTEGTYSYPVTSLRFEPKFNNVAKI